ncbi:succinate dehydrogenase, hydrophobic membrane anchor protein [Thioalkalivibrio denitrificans]|uniref:Succinate dehydrogenase hydrophobic membrane anchor subunit n=1 Tax=Thioalkalivibrio denitrificans TaxID=108003 RepID=A0A1V3NV10_9GAMM|nr:succinate dehydrogenase, hydrophobic membrane anchor protein [Thioalkalivibrio denitrificans]OOG28642.1 succinate dehydrogenase, hydrophobic membrane anchor protein [Thioalkalivibrio denitrificans]
MSGMGAWLWQRLTALYLGLYILVLLLVLVFSGGADAAQWQGWMRQPLVLLATALFLGAWLWHAWIGLRDVVVDYIHPFAARLTVLIAVAAFLLTCGVWGIYILIQAASSWA